MGNTNNGQEHSAEVSTEVAAPPPQQRAERTRLIVHDDSEVSHLMDSARFDQAQRVASTLASANFTPKHLRGATIQETVANCFRVVNQAFRWGMDPFAVADETYVVSGRLGYQGKLVAAVINTRSNIAARLRCEYSGEGDARTVTIKGRFANETEDRSIDLSVAQAKTGNGMWKTDPDQKLYYSGVTKWARRHCPEVILGVLTEDDVEKIAAQETPANAQVSVGHMLLSGPQMILVKAELKAGKYTIGEVLEKYPTLNEGQVNELMASVKSEKVTDVEPEHAE